MMGPQHTVFLDVQYEGMKVFLEDLGWNVETITEIYGPAKEDRRDDNIMKYAEGHNDTVIITQDNKLVKRLENKGHKVIELDMAKLANLTHGILKKQTWKISKMQDDPQNQEI